MSPDYRRQVQQFSTGYPKNAYPLADLSHYSGDEVALVASLADYAFSYLLETRGLTFELIEKHRIGVGYKDFALEERNIPRYGMAMVPVVVNGEVVSYTSRCIESKLGPIGKLKQYTPHECEGYLTKGPVLFNCDEGFTQGRKDGRLVLVEDPWSAMKLKCIGLLGTQLSGYQFDLILQNYLGPVVLLMDNDKGGQTAAPKIALTLLQHYPDVRIASLKGVQDPDENPDLSLRAIDSAAKVDSFGLQLSQSLK